MELIVDLWHLAFANLIQSRAPPNFEVQTEVRLTIEPQRADMLLLRRIGAVREDDKARVLRRLWPLLGLVSILEYKSPIKSSFRPGDLLRLLGYGLLYDTAHLDALLRPQDLTLVLVVASVTPTLLAEIARMGWTLSPLGGGYGRIDGAVYTIYVVVTDDVTEAERDEYLRLFSHQKVHNTEVTQWFQQWVKDAKMKQPDIENVPGWDEMMKKFLDRLPLEERLEGIAPEELLSRFPPEQRLAGLAPEQLVLALPLEMLRTLPEETLRSLSAEAQAEIRKRLRSTTD